MINPQIDALGNKYWFNENIKWHREDGPAIEYSDGSKFWCINGEYHREDGPAVEFHYGYKQWFYYGKWVNCNSQEEFERLMKLRMFW